MREALIALNTIVDEGVIGGYAIGGAIGASFYIDALSTEDVDAFVFLVGPSSFLVSLAPIYEALMALGGTIEREHIRFGEWPVQILSDANDLIAEAIRTAAGTDYDGVAARVFRPEYLCAIALQTGRDKDFLRVKMFLEQSAVDERELEGLVDRFGLSRQWGKVRDED